MSQFQVISDKLTAAQVPAAFITKLIEEGFDTEEVLCAATQDDLKEAGISLLAARIKIKQVFPLSVANAATGNLQIEVQAAATATSTDTVSSYGEYAYLLDRTGSSLGLNGSLTPKINRQFINRAAEAALAAVISGTGALKVFDKAFWQAMAIEDLELRERIDEWQKKYELSGAARDFEYLIEGVGQLFDSRFENLISSAQKLSAYQAATSLVGSQARVDVGDNASSFAGLSQLLPLTAEEISSNMIRSTVPESAVRASKTVASLIELLKDQKLQAYGGVVNPANQSAGAIALLEKRFGPGLTNQFRLALSYEALINAIAACPQEAEITGDYLRVIGTLAQNVSNLHALVVPVNSTSNNQSAGPGSGGSNTIGTSLKFGISLKFSLSLKFQAK